ncbi:hypothetical protein Nepgr_015880 [Nepenthes gracilis]|uniref:Uncharacterized protein n=1 Tax=Nepenthes gracilis TaxID=150966 RepID=A0AAD3XRI4_NEPGR|nr:hypothetical protein Nepgr_015880 [Nepenthes gracilis]
MLPRTRKEETDHRSGHQEAELTTILDSGTPRTGIESQTSPHQIEYPTTSPKTIEGKPKQKGEHTGHHLWKREKDKLHKASHPKLAQDTANPISPNSKNHKGSQPNQKKDKLN